MFTFHKWPKNQSKQTSRGRPKTKEAQHPPRPRVLTILEQLHLNGSISSQEYQTALWYEKTWHLYLTAIKAPQVKTTCIDPTKINSKEKSDGYLKKIESKWLKAQEILKKVDPRIRRNANQVICFNQSCSDIKSFTIFLRELEQGMRQSCQLS
jgi:hypothetical protein